MLIPTVICSNSPLGLLDGIRVRWFESIHPHKLTYEVMPRKGLKKCPRCSGMGEVIDEKNFNWPYTISKLCPRCNGTGYVPESSLGIGDCLMWILAILALLYFALR